MNHHQIVITGLFVTILALQWVNNGYINQAYATISKAVSKQ